MSSQGQGGRFFLFSSCLGVILHSFYARDENWAFTNWHCWTMWSDLDSVTLVTREMHTLRGWKPPSQINPLYRTYRTHRTGGNSASLCVNLAEAKCGELASQCPSAQTWKAKMLPLRAWASKQLLLRWCELSRPTWRWLWSPCSHSVSQKHWIECDYSFYFFNFDFCILLPFADPRYLQLHFYCHLSHRYCWHAGRQHTLAPVHQENQKIHTA